MHFVGITFILCTLELFGRVMHNRNSFLPVFICKLLVYCCWFELLTSGTRKLHQRTKGWRTSCSYIFIQRLLSYTSEDVAVKVALCGKCYNLIGMIYANTVSLSLQQDVSYLFFCFFLFFVFFFFYFFFTFSFSFLGRDKEKFGSSNFATVSCHQSRSDGV